MFVEHTPLKLFINLPLLLQIERFTITGGFSFIVDYSILIALTEFAGLNYLLAATIAFCVGVIIVYLLSIFWVYDYKAKGRMNRLSIAIPFVTLAVIGLGINNLIMYLGVEFFLIHYALCKIIATAIVMVFNFITRKLLLE